jgi:hypothetical protein
MNCTANIYFNQQCLKKNVIPNYAKIRVPNTSPAAQITMKKIHQIRIKDEIRFLHKKKQNLNSKLYNTHLQLAHEWGSLWQPIMSLKLQYYQYIIKKCVV